jgi:hypothetical protein
MERRLKDRVVPDMAQQSGEDALSFSSRLGEIVESDQLHNVLAFAHKLSVKAIVGFSGQHLLPFASRGHLSTSV